MGAGFPVDEVILDLIHLRECAIDAAFGAQHLVDIARRHAVGYEREFETALHLVGPEGTLARILLDVPEIRPRLRRVVREHVRAIGEEGAVGDGGDSALGRAAWQEVVGSHPHRFPVDWLEQTLVASRHRHRDRPVVHVYRTVVLFTGHTQ